MIVKFIVEANFKTQTSSLSIAIPVVVLYSLEFHRSVLPKAGIYLPIQDATSPPCTAPSHNTAVSRQPVSKNEQQRPGLVSSAVYITERPFGHCAVLADLGKWEALYRLYGVDTTDHAREGIQLIIYKALRRWWMFWKLRRIRP
jgi:hypothetical protein